MDAKRPPECDLLIAVLRQAVLDRDYAWLQSRDAGAIAETCGLDAERFQSRLAASREQRPRANWLM